MKPNPTKRAATKQKLMDAYIALLKCDSDKPITASSVIKQAQVNRSTFYEYFDNVEDLRHAVEDVLIENMAETAKHVLETNNDADITDIITNAYIQHGEMIGLFIGRQGSSYFATRAKEYFQPMLAQILGEKVSPQELPYVAEFMVSGLQSYYGLWFREKQTFPLDKLVPLAKTLVFSCIEGVSNRK